MLMKAYTDLEQSKKLAEILPIETADMGWYYSCNPNSARNQMWAGTKAENADIPCWSLAALMNLLPSEFTEVGKYSITTYTIKIRKYKLTEDCDLYQIAYGNYIFHEDGSSSWKDMINTGEKEDLLDATFQMICWLKENGKI